MTGRRLYDLFCDSRKDEMWHEGPLVAWSWLNSRERNMWNAIARRLKGVKR